MQENTIRTRCPYCSSINKKPESLKGNFGKCNICKKEFVIIPVEYREYKVLNERPLPGYIKTAITLGKICIVGTFLCAIIVLIAVPCWVSASIQAFHYLIVGMFIALLSAILKAVWQSNADKQMATKNLPQDTK